MIFMTDTASVREHVKTYPLDTLDARTIGILAAQIRTDLYTARKLYLYFEQNNLTEDEQRLGEEITHAEMLLKILEKRP